MHLILNQARHDIHQYPISGIFSRPNGNIGNIHANSLTRTSMRKVSFILLIGLLLTACGAKGPLYIPEQQYPQPQQDNK
jgi:predicted small lipoprotein YifL